MYLERLWQNTDAENEVQFLFRIDDIENTKTLINKLHSEIILQNPDANLPSMIYLIDKKIFSTNPKSVPKLRDKI